MKTQRPTTRMGIWTSRDDRSQQACDPGWDNELHYVLRQWSGTKPPPPIDWKSIFCKAFWTNIRQNIRWRLQEDVSAALCDRVSVYIPFYIQSSYSVFSFCFEPTGKWPWICFQKAAGFKPSGLKFIKTLKESRLWQAAVNTFQSNEYQRLLLWKDKN